MVWGVEKAKVKSKKEKDLSFEVDEKTRRDLIKGDEVLGSCEPFISTVALAR